jgi:hypothetical protein
MGRRVQNRLEKRTEYEAFERQQTEDEDERDEEEKDVEEEEDEEAEASEESGEEEEEERKEKKAPKKKPAKEPKPRSRSRARTAKTVRMKMVWGVFNNSNVRIATYEYPRRQEAEDHAARLTADKKSPHFVQPIKEPLEEKKEG